GFGEAGVDFLAATAARARHVVTNPPYGAGLADRFIAHALRLTLRTGGTVAMLLNLSSLCHPTRTRFWRRHAPSALYAVDGVICWPGHRYGPMPAHFARPRYCWAVWRPGHAGPTAFGWLSAADFREGGAS